MSPLSQTTLTTAAHRTARSNPEEPGGPRLTGGLDFGGVHLGGPDRVGEVLASGASELRQDLAPGVDEVITKGLERGVDVLGEVSESGVERWLVW